MRHIQNKGCDSIMQYLEYVAYNRTLWIMFFLWLLVYLLIRTKFQGPTRVRLLGLMTVIWFASALVFLQYSIDYWEIAAVVSGISIILQLTLVSLDLGWYIRNLKSSTAIKKQEQDDVDEEEVD